MARHGLRWVPGGGTHHEELLLSWDDETTEQNPTLTCEAILVRRELATDAYRTDLGLKTKHLAPAEAKEAHLSKLHPNLDLRAYYGTHLVITDPAVAGRVHHRLHLEHTVLNKAKALIEAQLPDKLKLPLLDPDGDPVIENGAPVMRLKQKHALTHTGERGHYHFVLPVDDVADLQALLDSHFDGRVTVEGGLTVAQLGLIGGGDTTTTANGGARFIPFGLTDPFFHTYGTESSAKVTAAAAFTASLLTIRVGASSSPGTTQLTFRISAANGAQTLSVPKSATGQFQDTTHSDAVAAGNTYDLAWGPADTSQAQLSVVAAITTASQVTVDLAGNSNGSFTAASYLQFASGGVGYTGEPLQALAALETATLSRLTLNSVAGNGGYFFSRINGADGNQQVVIGSSSGTWTDTTNTDAISSTSTFDGHLLGLTGSSIASFSVHYAGTTNSAVPIYSGNSFGNGIAGATSCWGLQGAAGPTPLTDSSANELLAATLFPLAGSFSKMTSRIYTNPATTTTPIRLFIAGGAAQNQTNTIPASTSGQFQDTTHSDSAASNSLYCYVGMNNSSVAGGALQWGSNAIFFATSLAAPAAGTITTHTSVAGAGKGLLPAIGTIATHTAVAGKGLALAAGRGQITTHTAVAGIPAGNALASFAITTHTAVAGHGAGANVGAGHITTHTTVAGKGLLGGQAIGTVAVHVTPAGHSAAIARSSFAINPHVTVVGAPRSTAQATFAIGLSTDVEGAGLSCWDWRQTVISQYANSPSTLRLILDLAINLNQNTNFQQFYDLLWNVDTAVGYGLDVWGRIVGVDRVLKISTEDYFSFQQANNPGSGEPFGGGPFFSGETATANFNLSDDAFRQLILAKAAANICDGSIPAINQILMMLFSELGNCYVTDTGNMTMTYTFSSPLNPVQFAIITESGVLPKPVGVATSIVQL